MGLITNFEKALEMGKRVYNSKMIETVEDGKVIYSDDEAIKALCSKVFSPNGEINNMEDLRSFNRLIVETANFEAQAKFEQIVNAVADYKSVGRYDQVQYLKVPQRTQTTLALSASATGVDFTKIPSRQTKVPAIPRSYQFGVQYQISEMVNSPVNAFRNAVDNVVEQKLKFVFNKIMELSRNGVSAGKIPSSQQKTGAGITLANFREVEAKLLRAGRNVRPVLIADVAFINDLALRQGTEGLGGSGLNWLTDELKNSLLRDINFDMISKSLAIPTDNPFIDETHTKVDLDPQEAILLSSGQGSPFKITEYGGLRTAEDMPSIENEKVLVKIDYVVDITLFAGNKMGYFKNTSIQA